MTMLGLRRHLGVRPSCTDLLWRTYASSTANTSATDEELTKARTWLAKLDAETIPQNLFDISFSRSSGPGGQNVNKYDTVSF